MEQVAFLNIVLLGAIKKGMKGWLYEFSIEVNR